MRIGQIRLTAPQRTGALVGGGLGSLAAIGLRLAVGSPRTVWHRLACADILPPLWLLGLLFFGWAFLLGATTGCLLAGGTTGRGSRAEASLWQGCTGLVLSAMLILAWYALLFGKCSLFISLLCLLAAGGTAVLCALSWRRISVPGTAVMIGYVLWLLCLIFWQVQVLFHN